MAQRRMSDGNAPRSGRKPCSLSDHCERGANNKNVARKPQRCGNDLTMAIWKIAHFPFEKGQMS